MPSLSSLAIVGMNHRSASSTLRERMFVSDQDLPQRLTQLRLAGLEEGLILSTCDRVELICYRAAEDEERALALFAEWGALRPSALNGHLYSYQGEDALRHLFAVASSLDSQMIGEPQVLGQVKAAHRAAREAGLTGPLLEPALQSAYAAAKRVRNETRIAERPVTIAASAMQVARDLHGGLDRCQALMVGLGESGELLAGELRSAGVTSLALTHPSTARAQQAAERLRCHIGHWDELGTALAAADIVVACGAGGERVLTVRQVEEALRRRRRRPMFFIDTAVPADVEPGVHDLDGAFVYDLDDLERLAASGRESRQSVATEAWHIVSEEVAVFLRDRAERGAVPAVRALREHFEEARRAVLADPRLGPEDATRLLITRLLHQPSESLRQAAAETPEGAEELDRMVRRLFALSKEHEE